MNPHHNNNNAIRELDEIWKTLRLTDRRRLNNQRRKIIELLKHSPAPEQEEELANFAIRLKKAAERSLVPFAERLHCKFPEELPITAKIPEICKALRDHNVVIVCGATGSGKTTQLPKAALLQGFGRNGRIGCTQPRRIAASALADRLANETFCTLGQEVGYQVRFDDRTSDTTVIKFMTDGILLAETCHDPDLLQYDCLILDEVHERSLNIDFLLGYVKLLLKRRKDLRVIISSATLESSRLSEFFGNAPVIEAEGRTFPVEDVFLPPQDEEELSEHIARGVEFISSLSNDGDILVFLPGEREIRAAAEMLQGRRYPRTEILPLFGRLSASDQAKIFQRSNKRRIVLSTNVAETSLTIPGIQFVIDTGLVRLSRFNPRTRIQELRVEFVSRASAMQRRGRCGRVRDGVCIHLYSEEEFEKAEAYTDPEIQRSSLAGVILQMETLRLPEISTFPFVDPPGPALIREGLTALHDLNALNEENHITETGRRLASIPIDPHLAKILLAGEKTDMLSQLAVIVAFLSISDPRERPFDDAKAADTAHRKYQSDTSDFLSILHLWCAVTEAADKSNANLRKFTKSNYLNYRRTREWRNLAEELMDSIESGTIEPFDSFKVKFDPLHKALLSGLPRNLAMLDPESGMYSDMNGRKCAIFPGSGLAKRKNAPQWILSFSIVETSRTFARCVAEIQPQWLEEIAPFLCKKIYDRIAWEETSAFVYARERVTAGKLLIHPGRRCSYMRIDPVKTREVFIHEGLTEGKVMISGTWTDTFSRKLQALRLLEIKQRRPDSIVNFPSIQAHFESVIPQNMMCGRDVKLHWKQNHIDFTPGTASFLWCDPDEIHPEDYPDQIESCGIKLNVTYVYDPGEPEDGLTYLVPENCLNLVGKHIHDYPVTGWMQWKVEAALRALPKHLRKELMPLHDTAKHFMSEYRAGRLFTEQPFHRCLQDFLQEQYDLDVPEDILENIEYPAYLKIRIALTDPSGKVRKVIDRIPGKDAAASTISNTLPVAEKYHHSGRSKWPDGLTLPDSVRISPKHEKEAYPALCDEGETIGCYLYLNQEEAWRNHCAGLARLIRLQYPGMIKQFRSQCKSVVNKKYPAFQTYPGWIDDLIDHSLLSAFRTPPENVRDEDIFEQEVLNVRDHAAGLFQKNLEFLDYIADYADTVWERLADDFDSDHPVRIDVEQQMDYLFRDRFFRIPEAVSEYGRYLKAIGIRLDRAKTSPGKDSMKGAGIAEIIRKFHVLAQGDKTPENTSSIRELFLMLEEARIQAWSPEIPLKQKVSPEILKKCWAELRF